MQDTNIRLPFSHLTTDNRWTISEATNQYNYNLSSRERVCSPQVCDYTCVNHDPLPYDKPFCDSLVVDFSFDISLSLPHTDPTVPRPGLRKQKFSFIKWGRGKRGNSHGVPRRKMFKVPLEKIIVNGQLPEVLQEMLIRLFTEAPQTLGIFRQSANYRKVKDIKEAIDNRTFIHILY